MRIPFADSPEFRSLLGGSGTPDVARIALEIAADVYSGLDPEPYLARIAALADRVRERCPSLERPRPVLAQLNWILFVEEEFRGNTERYDDPRNSYLNEVLDRKTGLPITLALLYSKVAERLGLDVAGVNAPAHFLLRIGRGDETTFIDPFHAGQLLDLAGCERLLSRLTGRRFNLSPAQLAPCSPRVWVTRMLSNLKGLYVREGDYPALLPVQRRLAALADDDPQEHRDLAMIWLQLDRPAEAIPPLQTALELAPEAAEAESIRALLRAARRDVALRN